jgi:hypothetical protein
MNDAATVVGLPDQKTLMEEIQKKLKTCWLLLSKSIF